MKQLIIALLTLGTFAACHLDEQAVAPGAHSSARTNAVVAGPATGSSSSSTNPWTNSGMPRPDVPLERFLPWPQDHPDSVDYIMAMIEDFWYKEWEHKLTFPVKIYFNNSYKGQISGFGYKDIIWEKGYPASKAFAFRAAYKPHPQSNTIGILDKNGYYYERVEEVWSYEKDRIILYNIAPNKYYWKLKYIAQ